MDYFLIVWLHYTITQLDSVRILIRIPVAFGRIGVSLLSLGNLRGMDRLIGVYLPYHHVCALLRPSPFLLVQGAL